MMLFWILVCITVFFAVLLGAKAFFNIRFCALCLASSGTWVALLTMYWSGAGYVINPVIIALLAGATMLGVYYIVERRAPERLLVFRLPFYLTIFTGFAWVLRGWSYSPASIVFLVGLWALFLLIYMFRKSPRAKKVAEHIIACCKDW